MYGALLVEQVASIPDSYSMKLLKNSSPRNNPIFVAIQDTFHFSPEKLDYLATYFIKEIKLLFPTKLHYSFVENQINFST